MSHSDPAASQSKPPADKIPWYHGVTRYEWLVLAIASAGWIFDVFEGQLIVAVGNEALEKLLSGSGVEAYRELIFQGCLSAFLLGGAVGGVLFGIVADRVGRGRTMIITILVYSAFTALTAFSQSWWHLLILRFLVGMGVGGEWAVAAAVVAEVFPKRSRPAASGIFHASSVLGTYLATAVGVFIVAGNPDGWRVAFLVGILPALLTVWVRISMREPKSWQAAKAHAQQDKQQRLGRIADLFALPGLRWNTFIGTALAVIGLATFWGAHIRGKDLLLGWNRSEQMRTTGVPLTAGSIVGMMNTPITAAAQTATTAAPKLIDSRLNQTVLKNFEMLGMLFVTTGGGLGLLLFAPVSQWIGRRLAFVLYHIGGFVLVPIACSLGGSAISLLCVLPVFGFFTLGMHAGYAVYFPELFPTRLRGTGAGFCFNVARILACPALFGFGWLQVGPLHLSLEASMMVLGVFYLFGAVLALLGPETRGQELPE